MYKENKLLKVEKELHKLADVYQALTIPRNHFKKI